MLPMGIDQVVINHLDVPAGHLQRGVPQQTLHMQRAHACPQGKRGKCAPQRMR